MSCVIAVLCADIHLSERPPVARSAESDWMEAQARPLDQLRVLSKQYEDCPIVCAGDIFDRHNSGPSLINWAITHLPKMYAIPGQHDLPLHNLDDIKRSAYWTLVEAGVVTDMSKWKGKMLVVSSLRQGNLSRLALYGYPWGVPPVAPDIGDGITLAVVHDYVWIKGKSYPGAPDTARLNRRDWVYGYDAVVFGDNHDAFLTKSGETPVLNCGCLIRRKSDERKYKPAVGLLYDDGHIEQHFLDTSEDKWLEPEEIIERVEAPGMTEFLEELNQLESDSLDFREAVMRYIKDNPVGDGARRVLLETIGG